MGGQRERGQPGAPAQTSGASDLPLRVLVADDEHLVASILTEYLRHLGILVIGPASNGGEALELARTHGADMALLDIRMPQKDGLEVAGTLYDQMGIPVVIVTAFSDPDYLNKGTRAGVFGYLLKPVSADELRATLAVAWARFRQQGELRTELEDLKVSLENRKLVERAKGVLMDRLSLGEAEAMRRLQKQARDTRRKLHEVARSILESEQLFTGRPAPGDSATQGR
jgi:two-component system, response regulator PdtaR